MFLPASWLLHMLFPLPGTLSPPSPKFLSIQEYYWTARPRLSWTWHLPTDRLPTITAYGIVCPINTGAWDLGLSILSVTILCE